MKNLIYVGMCLVALACFSCSGFKGGKGANEQGGIDTAAVSKAQPRYANGYKLTSKDGLVLLSISDPQGESKKVYKFALVPKGQEPDSVPEGYTIIKTPVESVVCMTALQLSNFMCMDRRDVVKGISSTKHLYDEQIKAQLKDGTTQKIGIEGNFDDEVVMGLGAELILISPFKRGGYEALEDCGIPLMPHLGYKELTPLGQAEWIKLMGLLIGDEDHADSIFNGIEERYNKLVKLTENVETRPSVMSGEEKNGHWYAPGGNSFLSRMFHDAGAKYFLEGENEESGGVTMDYEVVYAKAADVDYWRILNTYEGVYSYDLLKKEDARHADFKAFKNKGIIYCSLNQGPYYEVMPVQPDVILSDFIFAFHPELLPDYQPVYYKLLK